MKIAVLTAGGVAPGMNAAVRAVAQAAFSRSWEVVGVEDGEHGVMVGISGEEVRRVPLEEVVGKERPLDPAMYELAEMPE